MRAAILIVAGLLLAGCYSRPQHSTACGPKAVSGAIARLGLASVHPSEVSSLITRPGPGQAARNALALVNPDALSITWPAELEHALRHYGVDLRVSEGPHAILRALATEMERDGEVGIVLLRARGELASYHYLAFPPVDGCVSYFGGRAEFVRVWACRANNRP